MHQPKACLTARNGMTCKRQTRPVLLKHGSADAIAICMLLLLQEMPPYCVLEVRILFPYYGIAQGVEQQYHVGSSPTFGGSRNGVIGKRKGLLILRLSEVHRFLKNGGQKLKQASHARQSSSDVRMTAIRQTPATWMEIMDVVSLHAREFIE